MLFTPGAHSFEWQYSNVTATRISTAGWGTSHTPSTTAFSTYATLVTAANITTDVYGILLCFNNNSTSATIRNTLVNIGIDTAGGTSFTTRIPNLLIGSATAISGNGLGIWYYFPLYIPAGSSIGIQAKSTVTTAFSTALWLYGKPTNPESVKTGTYVISYGADTTNSRGTSITLFTAAGTPGLADYNLFSAGTTTRDHWWWQIGFTQADTTMTAQFINFELAGSAAAAFGSSSFSIKDYTFLVSGAEQISNNPNYYCDMFLPSGSSLYYAADTSITTADTLPNMIVYGLGG